MAEQENGATIAYFAVHRTQDNLGYIGGLLVINDRGVPQEFRCTAPIRPTNVQKALYGETLEPYMFSELIGPPLVKSLNAMPYCCVVETQKLLEMRERVDLPVIHLEKYGEALSADARSTEQNRLDSENHGFQPITATYHRNYKDDF